MILWFLLYIFKNKSIINPIGGLVNHHASLDNLMNSSNLVTIVNMHVNYNNLMGKLQNTFLKFGVVWILHPEIWEIGFHTLKFHSVSKTQPSISDLHMWLLSDCILESIDCRIYWSKSTRLDWSKIRLDRSNFMQIYFSTEFPI